MNSDEILVTQPFMPPLSEFMELLEKIWRSRTLSNFGPFHRQFESRLEDTLGIENVLLVSSGTAGLVALLLALPEKGEVITSPFSFAATATAIAVAGHKPVFVDIEPNSLNIDPRAVEMALTNETVAVMGVHCFGNACDVDALEAVCGASNVSLLFDAAHAFGVEVNGTSILARGDASVVSLHATKVLSSVEGGLVVCNDEVVRERVQQVRNFGFVDAERLDLPGLNMKMNELSAAFGLLQLQYLRQMLAVRERFYSRYVTLIEELQGVRVVSPSKVQSLNFSYMPLLIDEFSRMSRDEFFEFLRSRGIIARKYFHPLLSSFEAFKSSANLHDLEIATSVADRIICMPLHANLDDGMWFRIESSMREALGR